MGTRATNLCYQLAYGFVAGILLSALRAPLGLDLFQLLAVEARIAALFRAAALLAVGVFLHEGRPLFGSGASGSTLLAGVVLGLASHGFFLQGLLALDSLGGFAAFLGFGVLALFWLSRRRAAPRGQDPGTPLGKLPPVEALSLGLAGAGAAFAIDGLARHVRLFGAALPEDDTVFAACLALLTLVGAISFGPLLARPAWERSVATIGLALAAFATLHGLALLGGLGTDEIFRYLRRIGADTTTIGTLKSDAFLASGAFVACAFSAGGSLGALRHPRRIACTLFGAAAAIAASPWAIEAIPSRLGEGQGTYFAAWVALAGTLCAVAGALLAALALARGLPRLVLSLVASALALLPFAIERRGVWPFSPWHFAPTQPVYARFLPQGLLTVESDTGGSLFVTLDRRRLSPNLDEQGVDERRIAYAWSLLDPARRASGEARVLLVGQITPSRSLLLEQLGVKRLERFVPWHEVASEVDEALFEGGGAPGELVPAGRARQLFDEGRYDLVIVTPIHGPILARKSAQVLEWGTPPAPLLGDLQTPPQTVLVAWLDASAGLAPSHLGERVLLAEQELEHWSIGLIHGGKIELPSAEAPAPFDAGEPAPGPSALDLLTLRPAQRAAAQLRPLFDRLASAAQPGPRAPLARALAALARAQQPSSVFETRAQQIEIDEDLLRELHGAAMGGEADRLTRDLLGDVARVLEKKRFVQEVLVYIEPLAKAWGPSPDLDRAVASAYLEFDEPGAAVFYLERLLGARPYDLDLLLEASLCADRANDHLRAVDWARRAGSIQPGRFDLEKRLAIALLRNDDPEGRLTVERLAAEHPGDEELASYLVPGPLPELPKTVVPKSAVENEEHGDERPMEQG